MRLTQTDPLERLMSSTANDWAWWCKTEQGLHVLVQIDYHATEKQAREIVDYIMAPMARAA
jgi:hypothetical protein